MDVENIMKTAYGNNVILTNTIRAVFMFSWNKNIRFVQTKNRDETKPDASHSYEPQWIFDMWTKTN